MRAFDYSQPGAYFVTIVVQDRRCLFGSILGGEFMATPAGEMIESGWRDLPARYASVEVDTFVVMPNHFHGIVWLTEDKEPPRGRRGQPRGARGQPRGAAPTSGHGHHLISSSSQSNDVGAGPRACPALSLPDVVHRFKSLTTARYRQGVHESGWARFRGRLWQRNYYEHIIRDEDDLNRIRRYVIENPLHWEADPENPMVAREM